MEFVGRIDNGMVVAMMRFQGFPGVDDGLPGIFGGTPQVMHPSDK